MQPSPRQDPPPRTPSGAMFATRLESITAYIYVPAAVATVALALFLVHRGGWWWGLPVALLIVAAHPVVAIICSMASRRVLKQHGYLLCPGCRYPLEGLGNSGACPECGRAFEADSLQRAWSEQYDRPRDPRPDDSA